MKTVLIVGGTGTIGKAIHQALSPRHRVIIASRTEGDVQIDVTQPGAIDTLYQTVGAVDAVIATIGGVHFAPLADMNAALYDIGLRSKLMAQVNLVTVGLAYISDGGSFTLTSGILNHDPIRQGSSAAMVNGAIDGFVKGAAIDVTRGIRINAVSPTILNESRQRFGDAFIGFKGVDADVVAQAYVKSVEGAQTGQVYRVA